MFDDVELTTRSDALRTLSLQLRPAEGGDGRCWWRVSTAELDLRVVVHGHDKTEAGFFYRGRQPGVPCIFGAPKAEKRHVRL